MGKDKEGGVGVAEFAHTETGVVGAKNAASENVRHNLVKYKLLNYA